jgi:hypothetical protein
MPTQRVIDDARFQRVRSGIVKQMEFKHTSRPEFSTKHMVRGCVRYLISTGTEHNGTGVTRVDIIIIFIAWPQIIFKEQRTMLSHYLTSTLSTMEVKQNSKM